MEASPAGASDLTRVLARTLRVNVARVLMTVVVRDHAIGKSVGEAWPRSVGLLTVEPPLGTILVLLSLVSCEAKTLASASMSCPNPGTRTIDTSRMPKSSCASGEAIPNEERGEKMTATKRWPKSMPVLSPEQEAIREDFMHHWHEVLPRSYGLLERFNHGFPASARVERPGATVRTLEVGAGFGAHLAFEDLSRQEYTVLELRASMAERITERYPRVKVLVGDAQQRIPAESGYFDRVVVVHVLEHLPDLPAALLEIRRVLRPDGLFSAVLPCEGGAAYEFARRLSSKRIFEKRYRTSYDWCIRSEHVNNCWEIIEEVDRVFEIRQRRFWPMRLPLVHANLVVGVTCVPRPDRSGGATGDVPAAPAREEITNSSRARSASA